MRSIISNNWRLLCNFLTHCISPLHGFPEELGEHFQSLLQENQVAPVGRLWSGKKSNESIGRSWNRLIKFNPLNNSGFYNLINIFILIKFEFVRSISKPAPPSPGKFNFWGGGIIFRFYLIPLMVNNRSVPVLGLVFSRCYSQSHVVWFRDKSWVFAFKSACHLLVTRTKETWQNQ